MAKGPEITDEVRALVFQLHKKHPKWTNTEIRNWVVQTVHEKDKALPKDWPSKFAIDRMMPEIREQVRQSRLNPNPIDRPWSTASMTDYPIHPEALPIVLAMWGWLHEEANYEMTIREAQWAARLYALQRKISSFDLFSLYCRLQATTEMIYERIGAPRKPCHHLDVSLMELFTGKEMTHEQKEKILGEEMEVGDEVYIAFSEREAKHVILSAISGKQLPNNFEIFTIEDSEVRNERKQERSKNERRNKKAG